MKVEFRDSFAKDLKGLQDKNLLKRAKEVVEAVAFWEHEQAEA